MPFLLWSLTAAFVIYCFWPLTHYFFSQDDFYFLEQASRGFRASMEQNFNLRPGHFRPLTKGLYFEVMWPLFGLNPFPYHLISLLLHAANSILAGAVLRRLGVSWVMSWIATLLFAANVSSLEAVAWISCIQQLLGATFAFAALLWGVDALATKSRAPLILATIAYGLALGSYEQTAAIPLVLIVWQWSLHGWRPALRACRGPLLPMLVLLLAYAIYVLGARGLPESGPYTMWIGKHVVENFRQYTGSVFSVWLLYPYVDLPLGLRPSHVLWCLLIGWHLFRGMSRQLVFACSAFLVLLAPVLFVQHHVFSFHMYIPAIAAWYLFANAADSLVTMLAIRQQHALCVAALCAVLTVAVGSTVAVRANVTNYCSSTVRIPQLRVLRRAVLAEQVCGDVVHRWPGGSRLSLVYVGRMDSGNWGNIQSALNDGSALRLVLHQPTLAVTLTLPSASKDIPPEEAMLVTDMGQTFTYPQYQAAYARLQTRP